MDPTVARIQLIRTLVGFAAVVWMTVSYRLVSSANGLLDDRVNQMWINVLVLAVTLPVVVGIFVWAARPPHRRLYARRSLKPLGSMLAMIGSVFTFVLAAAPEFKVLRDVFGSAKPVAGVVLGILLVLWMAPFAAYGMSQTLVHVFRTADIHETVPPVLATVLVWELAVIDVATGAYEGVPFWVRMAFTLGAPLSVTAVTMWEFRRLRNRHGITLRGALLR